MDTKVVSLVDRPAIGAPFVVVKSEDGMPEKTQKDAAAQTDAALAAAAEPGPVSQPPASMPAAEMALAMPAEAKAGMLAGLGAAQERIGQLIAMVQGATEAPDAEMPVEPLTAVTDVAISLAGMVEPFVGKGFGGSTAQPTAADGTVAKADAAWSQEYIDSLPDCSFLYVEPSAEHDNEWRTMPLTNRHFPIRDHAYRLSLPATIEAMAQVSATAAPWLSEQKKRTLLVRVAIKRLDEVSISLERDNPVPPETLAEVAAIADMIVTLGQSAAPAMPAVAAAVQASAPPAAAAPMDMNGVAKRAGDNLTAALKKMAGTEKAMPMDEKAQSFCKAVGDAAGMLTKAVADFGAEPATAAPAAEEKGLPPAAVEPPVAQPPPVQKDAPAADEAVAKALRDLTAQVATLKTDNTALSARVAKAERSAPASNTSGIDPDVAKTAKSDDAPKHLPLHVDLAEHFNGSNRSKR